MKSVPYSRSPLQLESGLDDTWDSPEVNLQRRFFPSVSALFDSRAVAQIIPACAPSCGLDANSCSRISTRRCMLAGYFSAAQRRVPTMVFSHPCSVFADSVT